jgi:YVTN family beta-propeller protein
VIRNPITFGYEPWGVAVTPNGARVYVTNRHSGLGDTVSVINTATNAVVNTIKVGNGPFGVAVTSSGNRAYVSNEASTSPGGHGVSDQHRDQCSRQDGPGRGQHSVPGGGTGWWPRLVAGSTWRTVDRTACR